MKLRLVVRYLRGLKPGQRVPLQLAKLRRDLEEAAINGETAMTALRKKHTEGIAEITDQLDMVQKMRVK